MTTKISALTAGSTADGAAVAGNQGGATRKLQIDTAAYKAAGSAAGEVPVLNSAGAVAMSDGGTGVNLPSTPNRIYATDSTGATTLLTAAQAGLNAGTLLVNTNQIADGATTRPKIAASAVDRTRMANSTITPAEVDYSSTDQPASYLGLTSAGAFTSGSVALSRASTLKAYASYAAAAASGNITLDASTTGHRALAFIFLHVQASVGRYCTATLDGADYALFTGLAAAETPASTSEFTSAEFVPAGYNGHTLGSWTSNRTIAFGLPPATGSNGITAFIERVSDTQIRFSTEGAGTPWRIYKILALD